MRPIGLNRYQQTDRADWLRTTADQKKARHEAGLFLAEASFAQKL